MKTTKGLLYFRRNVSKKTNLWEEASGNKLTMKFLFIIDGKFDFIFRIEKSELPWRVV